MKPPRAGGNELKDIGYEIFIGAVSVLTILNLVLMYFVSAETLDTVLLVMNGLLTAILFCDFVYRLTTASSRSDYFLRQFGWADLLASLPLAELKVLRIFRLVRVFRLLRANGIRVIGNRLGRNRAGSTLLSLLLMGILVLEFGSLWILALEESAPDANITTASDAIWYVMVTISTVGYGDQYPVTTEGRLLGSLIIVIGVGIFGTFTGYLANLFLAPKPPLIEIEEKVKGKREGKGKGEVDGEVDGEVEEPADTAARVEQLRALMAQQQAAIDELDTILRKRPPGAGAGAG